MGGESRCASVKTSRIANAGFFYFKEPPFHYLAFPPPRIRHSTSRRALGGWNSDEIDPGDIISKHPPGWQSFIFRCVSLALTNARGYR